MDKVARYRQIIQEVLTAYGNLKLAGTENAEEFETQLIFDTTHDHYQLLHVGWKRYDRTFSCPIHIDIKGDKVWIQQNLTDYDFIADLIEKGIPKADIVLGFQAPYKRPYTEFAAA
jgi:hypothetical protein